MATETRFTGKHLLDAITGQAVCQGAEDTDVIQRSSKDPVADEKCCAEASKSNASGNQSGNRNLKACE